MCHLKFKTCRAIFNCVFYVRIHVYPVMLVFSFLHLSCTIHQLKQFHHSITNVAVVLQLSLMAHHIIHISDSIRCSSSIVSEVTATAVKQSGISITMAFMVMFILGISSSVCLVVVSGQPINYQQLWSRFV